MDSTNSQDRYWMSKALVLARKAALLGEVPVGAILVHEGKMVAGAYNLRESMQSPLGHAELLCLHRAAKNKGAWRLIGMTLYVTLEPCVMCAGALVQSRVDRLVFAASDPKGGAVRSLYQVLEDSRLNHRIEVQSGILAEEAQELLKSFFRELRVNKKKLE